MDRRPERSSWSCAGPKGTAGRALVLAALVAGSLGCTALGWPPSALLAPAKPVAVEAAPAASPSAKGPESSGFWERLQALLAEASPERIVAPLCEPLPHLPRHPFLASQGLDLGPAGGRTQDLHPSLTIPRATPPNPGFSRGPVIARTSSHSLWRAPVRGARAPPAHLLYV